MNITAKDLQKYLEDIESTHQSTNQHTGYEINDRNIFINKILLKLGYSESNILQDVPQRGIGTSKSADIRLYGKNEYKSKHSHSQVVIETKNYKLLSNDKYQIDYLQLKRYIKYNESKIRLIALTDYKTLLLFNATKIKKNTVMNFKKINSINKSEIEVFKDNLFMSINLEKNDEETLAMLDNLSYEKIFKNQKFINPQDYEATNSIIDPSIRKNFISVLYHLMVKLQRAVFPTFESRIIDVYSQTQIIKNNMTRIDFLKLVTLEENSPVRNYFLWGFEMNYLDDFMQDKYNFNLDNINFFLDDREKKDAFVLTSIYNIINKTMFLRILEDSSTSSTKFLEGNKYGRYISNGILEEKRKEGRDALVRYFIDVFKFDQPDLKAYDFILSKDIYNWVLGLDDYLITDLLIELIRLFNDTNFNKVNQDILGDIYEHYLEQDQNQNNKSYRRLLGQYYTPKPIVRFMWYLTRDVMKKSYNRDIYEKEKEYLSVIDPACGSGTFISEAILQINEAASNSKIDKNSRVYGFIKDRSTSKLMEESLFGFELNPLSKSIADINLFFALIQAYGGYSKTEVIEKINVYRTDSLAIKSELRTNDSEFEEKILFLEEDIKKSYKQKFELDKAKDKKFDIVIGNPPYGPTKVNEDMKNKVIPFAFPDYNFDNLEENISFKWDHRKGKAPKSEKNLGKLNDLYGYFFGVADFLCKENGIVSFITSNTYLTIPTYKWFRKYILENYTIDYLINFNKVSEKANSMFYPDAGIATSIIIMRKKNPEISHAVKYLDLSDVDSIKEKYEAFSKIEWGNTSHKINKNHIKKFEIKQLNDIGFKIVLQKDFFENKDYIFSLAEEVENSILNKIEKISVPITSYSSKNMGVDLGDVKLSQKTPEKLENVIESIIFKKDFKTLGKTLQAHLLNQFKADKINVKFDKKKVVKYVYQKYLEPYGYKEVHYTYLDPDILWRSRIKNRKNIVSNPILAKNKLFILERRAKEQILSLVTDENLVPQHGGRFMYLVESETFSLNDMYFLSAIINSDVLQYFYRKRLIGNKDILVPKLKDIEDEVKKTIIEISKEIHSIKKERFNYLNPNASINSKFQINVIEENNYCYLMIEDQLIQDYNVNSIVLDLESKTIELNSSITLRVRENIDIATIHNQIKEYKGNLLENPMFINTLKIDGDEEDYLNSLNEKINSSQIKLEKHIYDLYHLTEDEIKLMNS